VTFFFLSCARDLVVSKKDFANDDPNFAED